MPPDPPPDVHFGGIYERDIDLLLVVELAANRNFLAWFASTCIGQPLASPTLRRVNRGIPSPDGETDMRLEVDDHDGSRFCIYVENKIAAAFQPRQAERYTERAARERAQGTWCKVAAVLIAPQSYFGDGNRGFDRRISYEDMLSAFRRGDSESRRGEVIAAIFESAIRKAHEGYDPIVDEPVTAFWADYWTLCSAEFEALHVPKPGGRPAKSGFVRFTLPGLPIRATLIHKLAHGAVDLQIAASDPAVLQQAVSGRLTEGMRVVKCGKSAAIRMEVPVLNAGRPLKDQEHAVRQGLVAAQALKAWAASNTDALGTLARFPKLQ